MILKFVHNIPVEESMVFESIYPENLSMSLEDKKELAEEGAEFVYLKDGETGELIGETYFLPLDLMQDWDADEHQDYDGLDPFYGKEAVYCYSNTILPKFQKQGFGGILKSYMLGYLRAEGWKIVVGHARHNGSLQLNKSFGAEAVEHIDDWYQTAEMVTLYKQEL
jgi:hypothetical protein